MYKNAGAQAGAADPQPGASAGSENTASEEPKSGSVEDVDYEVVDDDESGN